MIGEQDDAGDLSALLRGVNVGGKNKLPMKDLAEMFSTAGCKEVRTFIQSGNVVFKAPASLAKKVPGLARRANRRPVRLQDARRAPRSG